MLVRRRRVAVGLTQQQLAARAKVSVGAVRDLEQGRVTRPRPRILEQLAVALGLDSSQRASLVAAAAGMADSYGRPGKGLWLRVLGTMGCWHGSMPVSLGPARQRAVAALLAVHPNSTVHREAIIDVLWPDGPPGSAVTVVQSHVSRLRKVLDGRPGSAVLVSTGTSYRLDVGPGELDLLAFQQLAAQARRAAPGDPAAACRQFEQALELWEGEPLADVDVLAVHPAVAGLTQLHASVITEYAQLASEAGRAGMALPQLRALTVREPLNEHAHALLMTCLAASGQQAHGLQVYEDLRQRLDKQLGVRPGPELASTHLRILRQEIPFVATTPGTRAESLGPAAEASDAAAASKVVPRHLPAAVRNFAGRRAELAELAGLLEPDPAIGGTMVISAIGGSAGVGKTALAVHWAHEAAGRFPDGQLYVNLRGYDPDQPMSAAHALAMFLRSLGVPGQDIPITEDERAARYRSLLAGQRVLVLLDNARSAEQVRPLLPGSPGCMTLVTSRDSLAGLVARDGARRLDLDLLPPADAFWLLRALIGARVDADPAGAAALAARCSGLPLALRVAAEFAGSHPEVGLTDLAAELADQQRQLDMLESAADPRTAVRTVFSWSYRHLSPAAARAFRLLGLQPGPDLDMYATAALTGGSLEQARDVLSLLTRAYLIRPTKPGRYAMHDLLRTYARELASAAQCADDQQQALSRLADYYLSTAGLAMHTLYPAEDHLRPRLPPWPLPAPPVTATATARAWLDEQLPSLVAITAHAADHGWPTHAARLADTLDRYLQAGGYYHEAIAIHSCAMRTARRAGDRTAEAMALKGLGVIAWLQGNNDRAARLHQQALTLFRQAGDPSGEARTLGMLGLVDLVLGRSSQAGGHFRQAAAMFRKTGDRSGEARALGNLGVAERRQGRYQEAGDLFEQALMLARQTGDRTGEGYSLARLGCIESDRRHSTQAIARLQQALAIFQQTGDRRGEAYTLAKLGIAEQQRGQYQQAADHHQQALTLFRGTGERAGEAEALNGLGETLQATGQDGEARARYAAALHLASKVGDTLEQARAHNGLAHISRTAGELDLACRHWRRALVLYTSLGAPEADKVRMQLVQGGQSQQRAVQ
jgi:DNA-binding SARP family transcriptional activator/tetratricopeptide (TPR) repeat protein